MRAVIAVIEFCLLATTTFSGELPARVEHLAKQARSRGNSPGSLLAAFLAPRPDVAWRDCDGPCLAFWTSDGTPLPRERQR